MGTVIFLSEHREGRPARAAAPGSTADIIIFQGVRFERLTDDMIAQATSRQRRLPSLHNNATAVELE